MRTARASAASARHILKPGGYCLHPEARGVRSVWRICPGVSAASVRKRIPDQLRHHVAVTTGVFCSRALVDDIELCDDEQWKVCGSNSKYLFSSKQSDMVIGYEVRFGRCP